ncbi:hypothetical protein [Flavihumibacter sp. CACIAM 22H1]|nr:hypothetical protein [Flavihumibacter sp. CACIAM 22H1]
MNVIVKTMNNVYFTVAIVIFILAVAGAIAIYVKIKSVIDKFTSIF